MAKTPSTMRELGTVMPTFVLPDTVSGQTLASRDLAGQIVVVAFICNHCPFVIHLKEALADFGRHCVQQDVKMVAISSNDAATYPADGPEKMAQDAAAFNYPFPYLYDESQAVAKAFDAACTPDFFVFDRQGQLAYRGQFDDSRPGNGKAITGADLRAAVDALVAGSKPSADQKPSIGCNIKWKTA
jgi:peroxiredoxin